MALVTEKDYQREIDDLEDKLSDLRQEEASLIKRLNKPELIVSNYGVIEKQKKKIKDFKDSAKENYLNKGEDYWLKAADNAEEELKELEDKFDKAKKIVDKLKPQKDAVRKEINEVFNLLEKLKTEAKKKGFKVRAEEADFEERKNEVLQGLELRTLKTEDDYQDKIDDLLKEVEDLITEAEDKGFDVKKREEEMEQEVRALKTEKDYQKAWNDMYEQKQKYKKQVYQFSYDINELEKQIKILSKQKVEAQKLLDESDKELVKIFNEGKKKGFDVKRCEEMDFEARKQEILASLEKRALETEKDYQKAYNEVKEEIEKLLDTYKKVNDKFLSQIDSLKESIKDVERKRISEEEDANKNHKQLKDDMEKIYNEAKKKGFSLKK